MQQLLIPFFIGIIFSFISCDCPFPKEKLLNGRFVYQKKRDRFKTTAEEGYVLRFKCYTGHHRIGSKSLKCLKDEWSDVLPICAKIQCEDPPVVENAEYILSSDGDDLPTHGSSATYICKTGKYLNPSRVTPLYCVLDPRQDKPRWNGEIPVCVDEESCTDPGVSKHGARKGSCCFSEDVLKFSCRHGYELVGNETIQCLTSGNWTTDRPLCRPLHNYCEHPPTISHGVINGSREGDYFTRFDEVEVLCDPGFKQVGGNPFVICEEDGEWNGAFGECTEITCDPPEPLGNGTILEMLTTNLRRFPYGFAITYFCDEGYRLVGGSNWRTCNKNGWSGKTPRCEAIQCSDPGLPEYGYRIGDTFEVGAGVHFKCFSGYHLLGSLERICKSNGQWSGQLSSCDTPNNYCPNPGIPVNGFKNGTRYEMGDKVGFRCRSGYIQLGSEVRECLPNRTWSGTETTCLGLCDFDNRVQVRDVLIANLAKKSEELEKQLVKYKENPSHLERGLLQKIQSVSYPERFILYFAFDVSGSVGKHHFSRSIEFAKAIVRRVSISENGTQVGALIFSSKCKNEFLPLSYTTTEEVIDALGKINYSGEDTASSSPLKFIRRENIPLIDSVFVKENIKNVIFLFTNGKLNTGGYSEIEAAKLKKEGVDIYCIGISDSVEKKLLYEIASSSRDSDRKRPNVFLLQNYATLTWLVQEVMNGKIDYSQCGLDTDDERIDANIVGRIKGGKISTKPRPWMAALYENRFGGKGKNQLTPYCGGTIINNYMILTAAHCVYDETSLKRKAVELIVKLGLTDVRNETYLQEFNVTKMLIHPEFYPKESFDYDIALLLLDKRIEYNPFVRPICLPDSEMSVNSSFYKPGAMGLAAGWGMEQQHPRLYDTGSPILKEVKLPLQPSQKCTESLKKYNLSSNAFTERMFCAGDGRGEQDICHADSGGPIMQSLMNSDGCTFWTQVGIISFGVGSVCALNNTYSYYTHVQKLLPWIHNTIEKELTTIQRM